MIENRKLVLLFFVCILMFNACNGGYKPSFVENDFHKHHFLTEGEILFTDNVELLDPRWIKFHPDSFLVLLELGSENQIKIIDLKDGSVQELVKKGRGPEELESAWGINIVDNNIWVFGLNQGKLIKITPSNDREFEISGSISLEHSYVMTGVMISDSAFLAINETDNNNRLALYNNEGRMKTKFGSFPSNYNIPDNYVNNDVFMATISAAQDGRYAVLGCTRTDLIEIFDIENGVKTRSLRGPFYHEFNATTVDVGGGFSITDVSPSFEGYNYSFAHKDYFYISYNGRLESTIDSPDKNFPNKIFQFSWDGVPMQKILI